LCRSRPLPQRALEIPVWWGGQWPRIFQRERGFKVKFAFNGQEND